MSHAAAVAPTSPRWTVRSALIVVLVLAPLWTLARLDLYFAAMTAIYAAIFGALAYRGQRAGGIAWPLAVAIGTSVILIAGWSVIRQFLFSGMIRQFEPGLWASGGNRMRWVSSNELFVRRLSTWESWSLLRWWLLFGAIAWWGGRPDDAARRARSLLGFSAWMAVLEVGVLFGTWVAYGKVAVVPEPQSMFLRGSTLRVNLRWPGLVFWTARVGAPTVVIGYVFSRTVMRARWWTAILGAGLLVPVVVVLSIAWALAFLSLREWHLIR